MFSGAADVSVEPQWEQVGGISYPDYFEVVAYQMNRPEGINCVLAFQFLNGEPEFFGFAAVGAEVHAAMDALGLPGTLQFWKRRALMMLAAFGANAQGMAGVESIDQVMAPDAAAKAWTRTRRALEMPSSARRDRVTIPVLEEAATVYREAWRDGQNPTQAVASHFHKSHSTAARWVGQARKLGLLGPSDGSRGGEVVGPQEEQALRVAAEKLAGSSDG